MAEKLARFSWLPGGLAAAVLIVFGRLVTTPQSAPAELAVYDRVMRAAPVAPASNIAIVTIDGASLAKLGGWPWPRDVHASLLEQLTSAGARVVTFTVPVDAGSGSSETERLRGALALLESSNLGRSEQAEQLRRMLERASRTREPNAHLASAIQRHGNVVLPLDVRLGARSSEPSPLPARLLPGTGAAALASAASAEIAQSPARTLLEVSTGVGHTQLPPDADGTVRSDLAAVRIGDRLVPSLAVITTARALSIAPQEVAFATARKLAIGPQIETLSGSLLLRPHYFRADGERAASFAQYPYWQVLSGEVPADQLRDRIVLVGFTGTAARDTAVPTPAGESSPAVFAVAGAVSSLLTDTGYTRPPLAVALEWIIAAAVVAFAAFALPAAGVALGALAAVLTIAVLVVSEVGLLSSAHLWVRLMLPAAAVVVGFVAYLIGELIRRTNARGEGVKDAAEHLRGLGSTFQKQGQLDLAFETYRRCPLDAATMDLLYDLGLDFERRRQLQKAANVYGYIASRDPSYRDLRARRARVKEHPLTRPPATRPVPRMPEPAAPESDGAYPGSPSRPARTLGRYEIERELGKGAMGTVYLGRDPKINRVVAIKAIRLSEEFEEGDLEEARARFFREAEMAGRLNHPAIVTVHDAGEDQGLAYIAMEYLRGQHLSHYTDPQRLLPCRQVMLLAARVADALHYAHRQNVVHRDIKPANIMFDPDTDELKITDFGIARLTDTSRTKTGIVLGTPSFMSPEQLEGRTLDGRSDQFALGVSLYQLLCSQLPFRADSMPRLMQKIATEPHASVRVLRPDLPDCIDPIIERVLSKSADARYATCAELAAALRECVGPEAPRRAAEPQHEWLIP